jgi:hypothetical protein
VIVIASASLARFARAATLLLAVAALAACGASVPSSGSGVSLPKEFPSDFPIPPSSKLIMATGPLPFVPPEMRGMTVQWSSTSSRADLETYYGRAHPGWRLIGAPITGPSAGPISLGTLFVLRHEGDGINASVSVGALNVIDSGILVQATILPARPSPPPP